MKGSTILIEGFPKGKFLTGYIGTTGDGLNYYPGIKMMLKGTGATTVSGGGPSPTQGRHTWTIYGTTVGSDNDPRLIAILMEDNGQGKTIALTDKYTSGTWGQMYAPLPGEEMNVLLAGEAGTGSANAFAIGYRLSPVHATGKYVVQSTSASWADFVSMEHLDESPDVDTLVWAMCQY